MIARWVWVTAMGLCAGASCSSDDAAALKRGKLAEGCIINTDCKAPLVCAFRLCHQQCKEQPDCELGQLCVPADKPFNVCQLPNESECTHHSDCPQDFRCAADFKCRPECITSKDCVAGQVCTTGVCAAEQELIDGGLVTDAATDSSLGTPCVYASNCTPPLVCINGSCLPQCKEDRDCPFGLVCNQEQSCVSPAGPDGGGDAGSDAGGDAEGGVPGPSACANGQQDIGETGIDCGGPCGACSGSACTKPSDCSSHVCVGQKCEAPTCTDGLQNGTESDIDCGGGACSKCPAQKGCWSPLDCNTGTCAQGVCVDLSCSDKQKGGAETDVDCGGPVCSPCATGQGCVASSDCASKNCVAKKCVPAGPAPWTQVFTGADTFLATDPSGNLTVASAFGAANFGGLQLNSAGAADLLLAKFTPAGALLWAVRQGGGSNDSVVGFGTDSAGNVLVSGSFNAGNTSFGGAVLPCNGPAFVAKYAAANGAHLWSRCAATLAPVSLLNVTAAGVDSGGNLYVAGAYLGSADFGVKVVQSSAWQMFVAKYAAATGDPVWVQEAVAQGGVPEPRALIANGADMIVAGDFYGTLTIGTTDLVSIGYNDLFMARVAASDGKLSSGKRWGDSGDDRLAGVARTAAGKLLVTGAFGNQVDFGTGPVSSKGGYDAFLMEVDPSTMTATWAKGFGSTGEDRGTAVASAPNGEIALAVRMGGSADLGGGPLSSAGAPDIAVARYNATGTHLSSKSWGSLGPDGPTAIVWSGPMVLLAGNFGASGFIDFGTGNLPTTGDTFLAHFAP